MWLWITQARAHSRFDESPPPDSMNYPPFDSKKFDELPPQTYSLDTYSSFPVAFSCG